MEYALNSVKRATTCVELIQRFGPQRGPNLLSLAAAILNTTDFSIYTWNGPGAHISESLSELEYLHNLQLNCMQPADMKGGIWTPFKSLEPITNVTLQCPNGFSYGASILTPSLTLMSPCPRAAFRFFFFFLFFGLHVSSHGA